MKQIKTSKSLQKIITTILLQTPLMIGLPSEVECKINETNLVRQYMIVNSDGYGALYRVYVDNTNPNNPKKCILQYNVADMLQRPQNKFLILFDAPLYKIE